MPFFNETVDVSDEDYKKLKKIARRENISVSKALEKAISLYERKR
jgi:predicted CopG family antitoxin